MSASDTPTKSETENKVTELKRSTSADQPAAPIEVSLERNTELPGDRNTVFGSLVTEDGDVVGLVAYSIYKQNKHDFLVAFAKNKGRTPDSAELSAYTMGESTPRRLAIYRHLAEATLDGRGPDSPAIPGGTKKAPAPDAAALNTRLLSAAIILLLITLAYLVARLGLPGAG